MDDEEITAAGVFMWLLIVLAAAGVIAALLLGPA
jgi:hypothetical protein